MTLEFVYVDADGKTTGRPNARVTDAAATWHHLRDAQARVDRLTEALHKAVAQLTEDERTEYVELTPNL